jgi:hypothetical protein
MQAGAAQAEIDELHLCGARPAHGARQGRAGSTEATTRHIKVPDAVFAAARSHFNERLLVELTLTIGGYNLVSRFLVAMEIDQMPSPAKRRKQTQCTGCLHSIDRGSLNGTETGISGYSAFLRFHRCFV